MRQRHLALISHLAETEADLAGRAEAGRWISPSFEGSDCDLHAAPASLLMNDDGIRNHLAGTFCSTKVRCGLRLLTDVRRLEHSIASQAQAKRQIRSVLLDLMLRPGGCWMSAAICRRS